MGDAIFVRADARKQCGGCIIKTPAITASSCEYRRSGDCAVWSLAPSGRRPTGSSTTHNYGPHACTWLSSTANQSANGRRVCEHKMDKNQSTETALSPPAGSLSNRRNRPSLVPIAERCSPARIRFAAPYGRVLARCAPFCTGVIVTTGGSGGITFLTSLG